MSWINELGQIVASNALDAVEEMVMAAWRKVRGEEDDAAKLARSEIKRKTLEAMVEALQLEVANQAAALGLPAQFSQLAVQATDVVSAFTVRAGRVPRLGIAVEEVADLPPVPDFDTSDTPIPDGSSER